MKIYHCSIVLEIKRIQEMIRSWRLMHYWRMAKFVSYKFVRVNIWLFHSPRRYPCYFQEAHSSYWTTLSQRSRRMYTWGEVIARCSLFPLTMVFSYWVFLVGFLTRQHLTRIMDIKGKCYEYYGDAIMAYLKYTCSPSFTCSPSGFVHKLL